MRRIGILLGFAGDVSQADCTGRAHQLDMADHIENVSALFGEPSTVKLVTQ
jgi:hypothetical protein